MDRRSLAMGIGSYLIWGFFPLYFHSLSPAGSLEIIAHRAFWGFISCLTAVFFLSRWDRVRDLVQDRETLRRLSTAGFLILANWGTYVYAVQTGHTVDAALGYFLNPLVTVALARIVLGEKLNRSQIVALGLGIVAVLVLLVGMRRLPWISLLLALTFGFYSLIKKRVANVTPPLEGMLVETSAVLPVAVSYYAYLVMSGKTSFHVIAADPGQTTTWPPHLALLIGSGLLTMIPLLLFARAAQGLPLAVLGLIQYINPILQMGIGVLVFHEEMITARWIGTGVIFLALIVLSADWVKQILLRPSQPSR